jgi:hypothetical protein
MKTLRGRQYWFHMLTPSSESIKVLDPLSSNIDSFLARDTEILPFSSKELCGTNLMFLIFENLQM